MISGETNIQTVIKETTTEYPVMRVYNGMTAGFDWRSRTNSPGRGNGWSNETRCERRKRIKGINMGQCIWGKWIVKELNERKRPKKWKKKRVQKIESGACWDLWESMGDVEVKFRAWKRGMKGCGMEDNKMSRSELRQSLMKLHPNSTTGCRNDAREMRERYKKEAKTWMGWAAKQKENVKTRNEL